ncbi:cation diffusion facilitator family transporter [Pseudalkalibacillus caeni]|uniref:Cation diffusion facilitator family transporter n=1 Tax=Exobacillus caeni TaxID=2574798 RepID=A0A5R9F6A6_9BACL|nr:cation diffusion facilitator family transporter [Pseudalkalibacillus caeni]TLS39282.1 cation diffusion facilitator family transporter [Pseudalkalibacillus caeni]
MIELLKRGNVSSGLAALGNAIIAIVKGVAAVLSGSGAMLATTFHSVADTLNQLFVFVGSIVAEKEPTKKFPTGFGRAINLFVLIAVIIISILAYETIIEGWHIIQHPEETSNLILNVFILAFGILLDGAILIKAMKEIIKEARVENADGLKFIPLSYKNVKYAAPPTRLVFYEDNIATFGTTLALIFILLSDITGNYIFDGIGSLVIGLLLIIIALKIGYENTIGLIGVAAPKIVEERLVKIILGDKDVVDIHTLRILQEGRRYHVESYLELKKGLMLADADDVKFRVRDKLLEDQDVADVTLGIIESDDKQNWTLEQYETEPEE